MNKNNLQALPFIILVGTIYGSNMVFARFSLGQYHPLTLVSLRLLIASLVYLTVYIGMPSRKIPRDGKLWLKAGFSGILSTAIPLTGFLAAMQYISSGMTAVLDTLVPVGVVLLAHVFLDEKLTFQKGLGTVIAFFGTGLLWMRGETGLAQFAQADWRGYAFAIGAVISSASGIIYARRFLRNYDAFDISAMRMISAALVVMLITLPVAGYNFSRVNGIGYTALVYLAIVGTFLAFLLDFYIVKRFGATSASQVIYMIPVSAIILGAIILQEQVTGVMLLGMGIIFVGLVLVNRG